VIIFDLDFAGIVALPSERDSILIADANAVATRAITFQPFETVSCWNREVVDPGCDIERGQLAFKRPASGAEI
jgi:hypothetical protein